MKKQLLFFLLIPFLGLCQIQNNAEPRTFSASGDAILRIQPNQVVLSFGMEQRGKELKSTKDRNFQIISKAIEHCKKNGVKEKYIQTDYVRISPQFDYERNFVEYVVNQSFTIVLEDLSKYEQIMTELLDLGINQVRNVEFRNSDLKEYRYKVREMAIEAAKEKAEFLTEQVGIKLGKIINIYESTSNPYNSFSSMNYANISQNINQVGTESVDSETLSIGMLSLKANVTLTYEVE